MQNVIIIVGIHHIYSTPIKKYLNCVLFILIKNMKYKILQKNILHFIFYEIFEINILCLSYNLEN